MLSMFHWLGAEDGAAGRPSAADARRSRTDNSAPIIVVKVLIAIMMMM